MLMLSKDTKHMHPVSSLKKIFMTLWKAAEALFKPKGINLNWQRPYGRSLSFEFQTLRFDQSFNRFCVGGERQSGFCFISTSSVKNI